ncbi:glycine N-acyltransferase-like [Discoglossus pictus]
MLFLTGSLKLATLRKALTQSFPESLKVCGALHHVIHDNPFNMEVLVDQWPEFTSVICHRPLEEMTDSSSPETNTYFMFSKDQQRLSLMLQNPQVVNWTRELQMQASQPELGALIRDVSSKYRSSMQTFTDLLYMRENNQGMEESEQAESPSELQFSSLSPDESSLVDTVWAYGGNESSLRYVERCIKSFPTICVRKNGVGPPIAWVVSEQSSELRMGYTDPNYRNLGLFNKMITRLAADMFNRGAPLYCHAPEKNKRSQAAILRAGYTWVGRGSQWNINPL